MTIGENCERDLRGKEVYSIGIFGAVIQEK
jgi:hypothetical protein